MIETMDLAPLHRSTWSGVVAEVRDWVANGVTERDVLALAAYLGWQRETMAGGGWEDMSAERRESWATVADAVVAGSGVTVRREGTG